MPRYNTRKRPKDIFCSRLSDATSVGSLSTRNHPKEIIFCPTTVGSVDKKSYESEGGTTSITKQSPSTATTTSIIEQSPFSVVHLMQQTVSVWIASAVANDSIDDP